MIFSEEGEILTKDSNTHQNIRVEDLGLIDYQSAWDYQERLFSEIVQAKMKQRIEPKNHFAPVHHFLFCEHPHVYTLGKSGNIQHLLVNDHAMKEKGISFFKINRGGDITYHGPGQIVGYPIIDLDYFFTDIGKYLRLMEESIIRMLAEYGIEAGRSKGETGVWIDPEKPSRARKICAIGVRCSRWVTMHGFALNVNTDLSYFNFIIPCGIQNKSVTSMQKELNSVVDQTEVKDKILFHWGNLFGAKMLTSTRAGIQD